MSQPDISILVVNYNTRSLLDGMFDALKAASIDISLQIVIVDNASSDGSVDHIRQNYPEVDLIANENNVGFGRANNQGWQLCKGRYVLLLNTDAFFKPDALNRSLQYMEENNDCGVLGARLIDDSGGLIKSCRFFPSVWHNFMLQTGLIKLFPAAVGRDQGEFDCCTDKACDWVPGCFYLIRRETIEQVGLFDPRYFLYYEEVDHCRAVKQGGWQIACLGDVEVMHLVGASSKDESGVERQDNHLTDLLLESELLYFRKHHGAFYALWDVLLLLMSDLIKMTKDLLKGRMGSLKSNFRHMRIEVEVFLRTRCGLRPTR